MTTITEVKLDFKDVLLQPKRSTLKSRSQVDLTRVYKFKHTNATWEGTGIIAANMDHVGTFEMAIALAKSQLVVALHKHYNLGEMANFFEHQIRKAEYKPDTFFSMGIVEGDLKKYNDLSELMAKKEIEFSNKVCIDVANGYSEPFLDFVKQFRDDHPNTIIMAGNVVTAEMTEALIFAGADIVKVGIGPGCWLPGELVNTKRGLVPIEEVKVGDEVKTYKNRWKRVVDTLQYKNDKTIVSINGMKSTSNHEYYVLIKKYKDIVTDDNIHNYAEWISAEKLSSEYLLLKQNR